MVEMHARINIRSTVLLKVCSAHTYIGRPSLRVIHPRMMRYTNQSPTSVIADSWGRPLAGKSSGHRRSREPEVRRSSSSELVIVWSRIPVFVSADVRPLVRTSHPSGSRPWTNTYMHIRSAPGTSVSQNTVGTMPPPAGGDSQIPWLPGGSNPSMARGIGVPIDHPLAGAR